MGELPDVPVSIRLKKPIHSPGVFPEFVDLSSPHPVHRPSEFLRDARKVSKLAATSSADGNSKQCHDKEGLMQNNVIERKCTSAGHK